MSALISVALSAFVDVLLSVNSGALAQTGSSPVGAMSFSVGQNATISMGIPLLRPAVTTALVGSASGNTLTFAASDARRAVRLVDGDSYYVEVVASGDGSSTAMLGQRFEVNEAATRTAAAGTVVLDLQSALNTAGAGAVSGLANYRIAVRPHWTLASLFGTGAAAKVAAAQSSATADQVLAWDGGGFSVYYLRSGTTPQWRNAATGALNQDGAIVPPGTGVYLRRRGDALSFTVVGEVRTNAFVHPPYAASQLVVGGFPVDTSPADWKLLSGTGITAGSTPLDSDQLLKWTGTQFDQYYLFNGIVPPQWRGVTTGLLDQSRANLFPVGSANLLILRGAPTGPKPPLLVQAVPFTL
jgi:uncharacterized protein (TIGR02597 family)